jgi:membrane protein
MARSMRHVIQRSGPAEEARPLPARDVAPSAGVSQRLAVVQYVKRTVDGFFEDDCTTLGAALAYYTVFSLAPLLLVVVSIAGLLLGRENIQHEIQNQIQALIGSSSGQQIQVMLQHAAQNRTGGLVGTIVGLVILLFGATGTFASLQDALNRVWHVKPDPAAGGIKAFLQKRLLSFGLILGVAFLLLASLVISAVLSALGGWINANLPAAFSEGLLHAITFGVSLAVITILFATIFKVLPDAKIHWREVWVGALVTSILFTIGKTLIGLYLGKSATASEYGAAGSFVVIVIWLYYASLILLLGAEFTRIWATAHGRDVEPEPGAVKSESATS